MPKDKLAKLKGQETVPGFDGRKMTVGIYVALPANYTQVFEQKRNTYRNS
jgi:hypothetical protein